MLVSDFDFYLPEELIAQHPPAERGSSRMLVLDRANTGNSAEGTGAGEPISRAIKDARFLDLPEYLRPGDLLVLNDSRVLPARLFATRAGANTQYNSPQPSGLIEVLLTEQIESEYDAYPTSQTQDLGHPPVWRALVRPARKVHPGETLLFSEESGREPLLRAEVVAAGAFGERTLRFAPVADFHVRLARIGHIPLPPYIRRDKTLHADSEEDRARYQTVYSEQPGSAAAPTAGLHFTPELLVALKERGVEIATLTLHVGLGTFQPVRVECVEDIRLHAERYTLPTVTAEALNRAVADGRRVVAVGTTTTRTLEHIAAEAELSGEYGLKAHSGTTSIFLAPGHKFRLVNGLLTNFHLPKSTLLMLVAAFVEAGDIENKEQGHRMVLAAYAHAIRAGYRFYSYGDCMLVL